MRRHELDPVSLLWGLFFLGIAVTVSLAEGTDNDVDGGWVLAAALVALGGVCLTVAVAGAPRRREREQAAPPAGPMFAPDGPAEDTQILPDGQPGSSDGRG